MTSPSASPPQEPTYEQLLEEAERLLAIALEKDKDAQDAMEAARAAFRRIGRPLPLFDRLDEEGR